mmetsp:Transcript_5588/g.20331  ORF Transcript_5588/g.20331 Transcript_5588/m.20331 type:complete len:244 (-) Transcript_5588:1364-2095(-)
MRNVLSSPPLTTVLSSYAANLTLNTLPTCPLKFANAVARYMPIAPSNDHTLTHPCCAHAKIAHPFRGDQLISSTACFGKAHATTPPAPCTSVHPLFDALTSHDAYALESSSLSGCHRTQVIPLTCSRQRHSSCPKLCALNSPLDHPSANNPLRGEYSNASMARELSPPSSTAPPYNFPKSRYFPYFLASKTPDFFTSAVVAGLNVSNHRQTPPSALALVSVINPSSSSPPSSSPERISNHANV